MTIQLPASGLRFKDLVELTNVSREEFVAACPDPFMLEVPVQQPKAKAASTPGATQKFKRLTPGNAVGSTLLYEPEDIMSLVRSRSGDAAQKVVVHVIAPQTKGANVVVVGRDPNADVVIDCPSVSKRHAEMGKIAPDVWQVKDLGSANGTIIDGQPVAANAYGVVRTRGDIRFGTYQAIFLSSKTLYQLIDKLKKQG